MALGLGFRGSPHLEVPSGLRHPLNPQDSCSRVLSPLADPQYCSSRPRTFPHSPASDAPRGLTEAGLKASGRLPRRRERGPETMSTPRVRTPCADAAPRGALEGRARVSERSRRRPAPTGKQGAHQTARTCLPEAQGRDQFGQRRGAAHAQAPALAPNQRSLRHHAQCARPSSS